MVNFNFGFGDVHVNVAFKDCNIVACTDEESSQAGAIAGTGRYCIHVYVYLYNIVNALSLFLLYLQCWV